MRLGDFATLSRPSLDQSLLGDSLAPHSKSRDDEPEITFKANSFGEVAYDYESMNEVVTGVDHRKFM